MESQNWSKTAGQILGKVTGIWFGLAIATLVLIMPTKFVVWVCSWALGLF